MKNCILTLVCYGFSLPFLIAADVHSIYLRDFSLALSEFDYYVEKVIDVRDAGNYIGFVRKGLGDRKVPATLGEQSAADELQMLFNRSFANMPGKRPLTIRVNKLLIYEVVYTSKAYAFAEVNLTFLAKNGDVYVELYETGTMVSKQGLEVTGSHEKNLIQALDICFKQFRAFAKRGVLKGTTVSTEELLVNPIGKRHYPIETASEYPKGIYYSLSDFLNNTPDTSVEFTVEYKPKKKEEDLEAIPHWTDPVLNHTALWGFSDGKQIFVFLDGYFHLIQKEANNFIVYAPDLKKGGAVMTGAILGGLVGALLADALENPKEIKYKIDFSTGGVAPLKEPNYKRIEARSAIYFTSFAKDGSELTVFVNGEEKCTLSPGQYYIVRTKPTQTTVEICVAANGEKVCRQIEPEIMKTEAYLCRLEKKGTPAIESPSAGTLQSVQERIRDGKATEACEN